jgi:hypothetical protein
MGVAYGKHLRGRSAWAAGVAMTHTATNLAESARRIVSGSDHLHARRLVDFWRGVAAGLRAGLCVPPMP